MFFFYCIYVSSMAKYIRRRTFGELKSHDYHILMQQILPLTLCGLMAPCSRMAIMRICKVYKRIYNKVYNPTDIHSFRLNAMVFKFFLEMELPLSFFDIMTHLVLNLVEELGIYELVTMRWMYHVERYMK
jgi:hypothetical protein